jgi:hypothetical protein
LPDQVTGIRPTTTAWEAEGARAARPAGSGESGRTGISCGDRLRRRGLGFEPADRVRLLRTAPSGLEQIPRVPEALDPDALAQVAAGRVGERDDPQVAPLLEDLAGQRQEVAVARDDDDQVDVGAAEQDPRDVEGQLDVRRVASGRADQHVLGVEPEQRQIVGDLDAGVGVEGCVAAADHHVRALLAQAVHEAVEDLERRLARAQVGALATLPQRTELDENRCVHGLLSVS